MTITLQSIGEGIENYFEGLSMCTHEYIHTTQQVSLWEKEWGGRERAVAGGGADQGPHDEEGSRAQAGAPPHPCPWISHWTLTVP